MRSSFRRWVVAAAGAALLPVGLATVPARAAHVACGQVITQSTTLDSDVGPCTSFGLIVEGDGVTLDLGGHRVFGTVNAGDGAGVLVRQSRRVTARNGIVTDFDGGVVVEGGSGNTVSRIIARGNIGESPGHPGTPGFETLYGDGIAVEASTGNRIIGNLVEDNGPFAGIGLYELPDSDHPFPPGPNTGNLVQGNVVRDNVACRLGPFCDNDGIRIEPQVGPGNVIEGNQVAGNGLDGISLFSDADQNVVRRNAVQSNGFKGAVPGDGIRVFASRSSVERNAVNGNAAGGLSVGRRPLFDRAGPIFGPGPLPPNRTTGNPRGMNTQLTANRTSGNQSRDLWDSNPNCDANVWRQNTGAVNEPPCTQE